MTVFELDKQVVDLRGVHLQGSILDIGGGGEGIISRHSGNRVIAIDKRRDELMESPDTGLKIVMDACDLGFMDGSFDNVTCFYSLMYMLESELPKVVAEIYRVLKPGGQLMIWDSVMPAGPYADVLLVPLTVVIADDLTLTPTYGVSWDRVQSANSIWQLCHEAGFKLESMSENGTSFTICLGKA